VAEKPNTLTRKSGDLPKEGDQRLLANQHAVLKPGNLINLPDAGQISVLEVEWNPWNLSDLHRDCGMKLLANDSLDVRQLNAKRMVFPDDRQPGARQPNARQPDAREPDAGQPD